MDHWGGPTIYIYIYMCAHICICMWIYNTLIRILFQSLIDSSTSQDSRLLCKGSGCIVLPGYPFNERRSATLPKGLCAYTYITSYLYLYP